jgi:hypothetical protein
VRTADHSGLSVGELLDNGVGLTTREVVALLYEVCRNAGAAFPLTPDDLWIADSGELLIAESAQSPTSTDPRTAVADLLEAMLPGDNQHAGHAVPAPLRGLPARLRGASGDVGPQVRQDLASVLSWHLAGDARTIIQQLIQRVAHRTVTAEAPPIARAAPATTPAAAEPGRLTAVAGALALDPAVVDVASRSDSYYDLDLHAEQASSASARLETAPSPHAPRPSLGRIMTALAVGALFIAIGAISYWLVRDQPHTPTEFRDAPATAAGEPIGPPPRTAIDGSPAAVSDASRAHPLQLSVAGGAFSPTFGANGHDLFFHAGHSNTGRLLAASLDDRGQVSRVRTLLDEPARNYHPRISPDGRQLAFDSDRDGERGVYVSQADGSNPQRVNGSGYGAVPSWSPDTRWLAFIRGETERPRVWNLWLRDLSSGTMQRHTSFLSGQVWGASWFPDGRSLCYSHETQLVISHLDGRQDIVIETPRPGRLVRTPAVSPDGRRVVFQVFKDGVWLLDLQTRQMRRLLDDPSAEEFSWAPGGDRIAYHSRRDGAWRIWMLKVPG